MNDDDPVGNAARQRPSARLPDPASTSDLELLKLAEKFCVADRLIGASVAREGTSDGELMALHRRWEDACVRAAAISASTKEGQRAKARMLLAVLDVTVPQRTERELHEQLAESLARDLIS